SPVDGATDVAANTNISFTFSEPVTVDSSSFTISCDGNPQTFQVSGSGTSSITLDPDSDLPTANCTVTAVANQISDVDSVDPPDNMADDYNFSFTSDSAPAVTTTTPADNATDVDPASNITVNFSEAVDVTTSSFTISCNSNPQTFAVSGSGTSTITLNPDSDLPGASCCTVTAAAANISGADTCDPPDLAAVDASLSITP